MAGEAMGEGFAQSLEAQLCSSFVRAMGLGVPVAHRGYKMRSALWDPLRSDGKLPIYQTCLQLVRKLLLRASSETSPL